MRNLECNPKSHHELTKRPRNVILEHPSHIWNYFRDLTCMLDLAFVRFARSSSWLKIRTWSTERTQRGRRELQNQHEKSTHKLTWLSAEVLNVEHQGILSALGWLRVATARQSRPVLHLLEASFKALWVYLITLDTYLKSRTWSWDVSDYIRCVSSGRFSVLGFLHPNLLGVESTHVSWYPRCKKIVCSRIHDCQQFSTYPEYLVRVSWWFSEERTITFPILKLRSITMMY